MPDPNVEQTLRRGVAWLVGAQADDGGWHSATYGALRGGAAVTSLALYALSSLPEAIRDAVADSAREAGRFLTRGIEKRRTIACPDGSLDYPVYASAQVLMATRTLPLGLSVVQRQQLVQYLLDAQLLASQGFRPADKHFGGWDLAGAARGDRPSTGSNLSYVRFALEGLSAALAEGDDAGAKESAHARRQAARAAALRWLDRCQQPTGDGGFVFSPDPTSLDNKAQWHDQERQRPRSYGTTTCDGLRALVACDVPADSPVRHAAAKWLDERWDLARVPGLPLDDDGTAWSDAMRFYYAEALAGALPLFSSDNELEARRAALARSLVGAQRGDGSWRNASSRMREDDPLIATSLAISALCASSIHVFEAQRRGGR